VTSTSAQAAVAGQQRPEPPFPHVVLEETLKLLGKAVRAHQLYLHNNPIYQRSIELLRASFAPAWAHVDEIALQVTETQIVWEGKPVLEELEKSSDSLPWLFYKDGVRELRILRGFEEEEVVRLLDIIQRVRKASPEEDDLLTMLWEQDFAYLRYRYVDLAVESAPPVDSIVSEMPRNRIDPRQEEEVEEKISAPRSGIVNLDDFDSTLYFLDEQEIGYLRGAVDTEYAGDLRRNVVSMLLDVFELQSEQTVRDEVIGILDNLMLHLLSATQFRAVAFLLREAGQTMQRARALEPAQRDRLGTLPDRLSQPAALSQLLESLDEASDLPPQEELTELFEQLRPSALGTVFAWLPKIQAPQLRFLLEGAAGRLAASHTSELVKLISSTDRVVALEAARRAAALKSTAAVSALAKMMVDNDAGMRLAAVQALAEVASPGALQNLERAIDDADRDVRVAAARSLATRNYRQALPRVESAIKGKAVREADLTEKMAMFEAYGALCGDGGVPVLDVMLNGKGFLGRREDPELRACAAMALGRIGTPQAQDSLRKAINEKEVLVRNAVNRAMRGVSA
jgi:HEAT repeat protein